MLNLQRNLLVRSVTRRVLLSTAKATDGKNYQFEALALDQEHLLPAPIVTHRVLKYLEVDPKKIQRVLSSEKAQPLPHKALFSPQQVRKLTPLARWGFQQLENDSLVAKAVFEALEPHANMARGAVWWQYFLRQFFLSGAPLQAYLRAYKTHLNALAANKRNHTVEDQKADTDGNGDEKEDDESEMAVCTNDKQTAISRKNNSLRTKLAVTVLAESKEWGWVPLHIASTIIKEFCYRGRFAEAIESYALLPLSDVMRRDVVAVLQNYEQFLSVLYLYEVHRTMSSTVAPLDIAQELDALKRVGRVDEMEMRFQELPAKEQSRADIQKLMNN